MLFCCLLIFFSKSTFLKKNFRNTIRVSNSLDPDQARHFVWPDLVPNCLQRLSTEDTSRQGVKRYFIYLQVGTEDVPFEHKAIITLHGHHRSQELPIYGTKVLAVRNGSLELHG